MSFTLDTQNPGWGFFGSMKEHASAAWPQAMNAISKATEQPLESVRFFLDSRHGRHYQGNQPPRKLQVTVLTLADASAICRKYIDDNELGGGNWTGGQVFEGPTQLARVSYNGRVWAMDGTEIHIEPAIQSAVDLNDAPASNMPRRRP